MGLKTPEQYRASLRDGRTVFYRGARVEDVTRHPALSLAVDHAAIDYALAQDPEHRELAVLPDPSTGKPTSRFYHPPRNAEDLLARTALIAAATRAGGTLVTLIKEIGSDALFAARIVAEKLAARGQGEVVERVERMLARCRAEDLAVAVAQTDVKGDRSRGPTGQAHPDYYLRIVEEQADGVVVRGAKAHTSVAVNSHELIVLPTRALGENEREYAIAFALPVATPGLLLIASPFAEAPLEPFEHPLSSRHRMVEALTIFDDVFVPRERLFLCGQWDLAGPLALTFVQFHRFTAVSYKLPLLEALVGAATALAQVNGIERAGHVREKLTRLAAYHTTIRGLIAEAARCCRIVPPGIAVPDPLLTNVAKWQFAANYHQAVAMVQDIAGGLLVTAPGVEDLRSEATGPRIARYLTASPRASAEERLRLMNLVRDLTASAFGGYQEVLAVHAEGSIEAEKIQTFREYDFASAAAYARHLAGL